MVQKAKIPKVLRSKCSTSFFFFRQKRPNVTISVCSLFFNKYLGYYRDSKIFFDSLRITKIPFGFLLELYQDYKIKHDFFGITENQKGIPWGLHRDSKKSVKNPFRNFKILWWDSM